MLNSWWTSCCLLVAVSTKSHSVLDSALLGLLGTSAYCWNCSQCPLNRRQGVFSRGFDRRPQKVSVYCRWTDKEHSHIRSYHSHNTTQCPHHANNATMNNDTVSLPAISRCVRLKVKWVNIAFTVVPVQPHACTEATSYH